MTIVLTVLHVTACLLLIIVILLQAGRGQGLSPTFGSGNVQTLFGTRAGDFLTKATSVAAICFLLTSIGLDYFETRRSRSLLEGPRKTAPLDIEQVKRALEKIKQEAKTKPAATAEKAAVPAAATEKSAPAAAAPAPEKTETSQPQPSHAT